LLNPHQVYEVSLDGTSDKTEITLWQWMVRGTVKQFYPIHRYSRHVLPCRGATQHVAVPTCIWTRRRTEWARSTEPTASKLAVATTLLP
jgi:hypothetical protein